MSKLVWDKTGERLYETGVKKTALYPLSADGTYPMGVPWNGVTAINESPSGAEASPLYADDIEYANMRSAEKFGFTIEAYTYPDEFGECDGSAEIAKGVYIAQQPRKAFGLSYVTTIGNDVVGTDYGYKLHLVYGGMANPSEQSNSTMDESPEAKTMSWKCTTTPVAVTGFKPTAHLVIKSTGVDAEKLAALEAILYGTEDAEPRLPLPDEVVTIIGTKTEEPQPDPAG